MRAWDGENKSVETDDIFLSALGIPVINIRPADYKGDITMRRKEWEDG